MEKINVILYRRKNMTVTYKRILSKDNKQVKKLITIVLDELENKDFFIPIFEDELKDIYNEEVCILYGAYDKDKLVAMAKLDLNDQYDVAELKQCLNLENYQVFQIYLNFLNNHYNFYHLKCLNLYFVNLLHKVKLFHFLILLILNQRFLFYRTVLIYPKYLAFQYCE